MTRVNVTSVLDMLGSHRINCDGANAQLAAMGAKQKHLAERFMSGELSYDDIFSLLGV